MLIALTEYAKLAWPGYANNTPRAFFCESNIQ